MSLKEELQAERVSHLDLSNYCQLPSSTLVRDVLATMRQKGSIVCLVIDNGRLAGIFTERDVLQKVVASSEALEQPVAAVMTANPVTVSPDQPAINALQSMDTHHFRNLPVVDKDGRISGTMTHHAIIEFLATRYPTEVLNRPPRPAQFPSKAEGG